MCVHTMDTQMTKVIAIINLRFVVFSEIYKLSRRKLIEITEFEPYQWISYQENVYIVISSPPTLNTEVRYYAMKFSDTHD